MSKVTGIPLEVTGKWINLNSFGNLQFKYEVTALSTGPISPNEFYIPADFKEVRTSAYPTPLATN